MNKRAITRPAMLDDLVSQSVGLARDLLDFDHPKTRRWAEDEER